MANIVYRNRGDDSWILLWTSMVHSRRIPSLLVFVLHWFDHRPGRPRNFLRVVFGNAQAWSRMATIGSLLSFGMLWSIALAPYFELGWAGDWMARR